MKFKFFYSIVLISLFSLAQKSPGFKNKENHFSIDFKLINNLVVIPAKLNDSTNLNLVLDSGSPYTLITDQSLLNELFVKKGKVITIGGPNHGYKFKAYSSRLNNLKIGRTSKENTHLLFFLDSPLELSKLFGFPVHGVIGFDIFIDFVIEINYRTKKIHFYKHNYFYRKKGRKLKKFKKTPIELHKQKPYLKANIFSENNIVNDANMLIDTGGWDAIWWLKNSKPRINVPKKSFKDTLGHGINGSIIGFKSKTDKISIANFELKRPTTSFPDSLSLSKSENLAKRNGSIGGEILRRFHAVFDYKNKCLYLKANNNFNDEFYYDLSGMKLQKPFNNIPFLEVTAIRKNSPADLAGILVGDLITKVNRNKLENHDLSKIKNLLKSKPGKKITVFITRDGNKLVKRFKLKDPL